MIIVDANLLIYAVNQDAPLHHKAKTWLQDVLSGSETVGLSWIVLLAFLRITTRPGLLRSQLPLKAAFALVDSWLAEPVVTLVDPGARHLRELRNVLEPLGSAGNLVSDAHLAALAIEHGAELCSSDDDFRRFPGLKFRNPLSSPKTH